jgi:hypothetical protein
MTDYSIHINKKRITLHSIFWLCWILGFTFIQSFGFGIPDFGAWLFYYIVTLPLFIAHTYLIAYWLVPVYFLKKRYWLFTGWIIVLLSIFSVFELVVSNELVWKHVKPMNVQPGNYFGWQNILINGLGNEYIIIVFLSVKVVRFWNSKVGEKTELLNQQLSNEIELLKYQSYPRFILNVTDKLEALAQKHSTKTPEMIIRLSNLMNSMFTGEKSDKILLQKEIELISSYIEIQRMGFPIGYDVNFQVSGDLNGLRIAPFLLFQLVEEGFVVLGDFSEKTDFTIFIKAEPHCLLFSMTLWNDQLLNLRFNPEVMENCRKYLAFFYPENHQVQTNFEINFIELSVEIKLL